MAAGEKTVWDLFTKNADMVRVTLQSGAAPSFIRTEISQIKITPKSSLLELGGGSHFVPRWGSRAAWPV